MSHRPSPFSRRQFVKAAAMGAAALAAPMIIPSRALGKDKTAVAPSERLTLGMIGMGKMNSSHLGTMLGKVETQIVAVCDVHAGRREHARNTVEKKYAELERKGYKGCETYVDYRELLARKDIDGVFIATPDHWHTAIAIEACKAGKDIYCQKPMTLTIHEARTMMDAVRKYKRVFQTGSQQRSQGPFRQACDYIRNGRIGKIKEVFVCVGSTSRPCDLASEQTPEGIEWDMWLGQAPERAYNDQLCRKESDPGKYPFNPGWRDFREFSGGYVTDWGAHHFDITQWALDMDRSGPSEILPPEQEGDEFGARLIYRGSPVGDEIVVTHAKEVLAPARTDAPGDAKPKKKAKSKKTAEKNCEDEKPPAEEKEKDASGPKKEKNGILFVGEKGRLFVNRIYISSDPASILKEPLTGSDKRLFASPGHEENWMNCIKTRELPLCDVEVGARSVTVCHLVNMAYWHGRKLNWDAAKWEFPGDAEANAWRTRERRAKYQLPEV